MKNNDIKKAWDHLTPDEDTKERMLKAIIAQSAATEPEKSAEPMHVPWYVRFRIPMGISAAAMACAMVVTLAVGNPTLMNNGGSRQELLRTQPVSGMHTTVPVASARTGASASETEVTGENISGTTQTTFTMISSEFTELSLDNFLNESSAVTETVTTPKPVVSEVVTSPTDPAVASSITTAAPVTTLATVTETIAEMPVTETSVVTETTQKTEAETTIATTTHLPSLYGNVYDFNHVTWSGLSYDTAYETVPYESLIDYLGSGVAVGDTVNGAYTILLYEIKGVPVERGFAVQYSGQSDYYLFYCVG